jgi:hypothetical protein
MSFGIFGGTRAAHYHLGESNKISKGHITATALDAFQRRAPKFVTHGIDCCKRGDIISVSSHTKASW